MKFNLEITYTPVRLDGSHGIRQTCHGVAREGETPMQAARRIMAEAAARHGGSDIIHAARFIDR